MRARSAEVDESDRDRILADPPAHRPVDSPRHRFHHSVHQVSSSHSSIPRLSKEDPMALPDAFAVFEQGTLPRWTRVRQRLDATLIEDIAAAMAAEFARPVVAATIGAGTRVALTAGSRGI